GRPPAAPTPRALFSKTSAAIRRPSDHRRGRERCPCRVEGNAHGLVAASVLEESRANTKTTEDSPMDTIPLGPGFAAELRGVTLAEVAADDAAYKETRAAFEEHSVLVFRGQDVTDEAQLAFSRRFGPLEITKVGSQGVGTNLVILTTIDENGKVVPAD